jgi:hypothetical protein
MRSLRVPLATGAAVAAVALAGGTPSASAATPGPSRVVAATLHRGVRTIGDLRVGPLESPEAILSLADVRDAWGPERTLRRPDCTASWGTGVRLLFESFGIAHSCADKLLQVATVVGPRWEVDVGQQAYRVGLPRTQLPPGAKRIPGRMGGYELATTPFPAVGHPVATVVAHVDRRSDRVDRYALFIGGAGE